MLFVSKIRVSALLCAVGLLSMSSRGFAQVFPPFPTAIESSQFTMDQGTSAASVPNGASGTVVMSVFASGGRFGWASTVDGKTY